MVALESRERDLLQQPFLEWLGPKLCWAEDDDWPAAMFGSRPGEEDVSIVVLKIGIVPIALEDRSVGEQCRIQQRDHGRGQRIGAAIGQPARDALQYITGRDRTLRAEIGRRWKLTNEVYQPSSKIESGVGPFTFCNAIDRTLYHSRQMQCDSICSLRRPQCRADRFKRGVQTAELLLQHLRDQDFIEAALKGSHPLSPSSRQRLSTFRILSTTPKRTASIASPFGRTLHHGPFATGAHRGSLLRRVLC